MLDIFGYTIANLKTGERFTEFYLLGLNGKACACYHLICRGSCRNYNTNYEAERARLRTSVDAIRQRQHLVKADLEIAMQLATELDFLFEKGNFDERRLLCETVFKRLCVRQGKIAAVELNSPFGLISSRAKGSESAAYGGR